MTNCNAVDEEPRVDISASGLPGSGDCFRRWAVQLATSTHANNKYLKRVFKRHGFLLPVRGGGNNIGSSMGTACHEGIGKILQVKIDGGLKHVDDDGEVTIKPFELTPSSALELAAKTALSKFDSIKDIGFDAPGQTTPNRETAVFQIERMIQAFVPHALTLSPKQIEFSLEARLDPLKPYYLTGHPDIQETDWTIRDMKFGSHLGSYQAQVGGYRLMARSNGMDGGRVFVDWLKRGVKSKPQPALQVVEYDMNTCETAAYYISEDLMRMLEKFIETGNPWSFPVNNSSNLCSRKWCPAHSTDFCDMGKPDTEFTTQD